MIQVFYIRIQDIPSQAAEVEKLMTVLPLQAIRKLDNISNVPNKLRSALGEILTRYAIQNVTGIGAKTLEVSYGTNGKPYLEKHPDVHFNISHSGDYIVCAVSGVEVGIDVERCRAYNPGIAERFFSKPEYADLMRLEEDARRDYFFTLWTIKESYLKALGRGLTKSLGSFTVTADDSGFRISGETSAADYSVFSDALPGDYKLAVSYKSALRPVQIREVTLHEISLLFTGL